MYWTLILITALIGMLVWTGIAYPGLSRDKGWPADAWARSDNWAILLWIGVAATIVSGLLAGGILGMLIVIALVGPLTFGITEVLKDGSQLAARIGGIVAVPWALAVLAFRWMA